MENQPIIHGFRDLREAEQVELNGGGVGLLIVGGILLAGATLAADEYVERKTGKDILSHIGDGLVALGNFLRD